MTEWTALRDGARIVTVRRLAVYGKGGSGKSTIASNISVHCARRGLRTLQIGCDPKHDSTRALTGNRRITTIVELLQGREGDAGLTRDDYVFEGALGVGCVEAGGPESGIGCAGLGITAALRLIDGHRVLDSYDVVLFDVLGDVVCGGFATPLMRGLAGSVVIAVGATQMSLYAANNIARAIRRYQRNGVGLVGLVANNVGRAERIAETEAFARRLGTRLLATVPADARFALAEREGQPVSLLDPGGPLDAEFGRLADLLLAAAPAACATPTPMTDAEIDEFFRETHR